MNEITKKIEATQKQLELVDTPSLFAPNQILVTDNCGQIVDSGISPALILKMHTMLLHIAGLLRELFVPEE